MHWTPWTCSALGWNAELATSETPELDPAQGSWTLPKQGHLAQNLRPFTHRANSNAQTTPTGVSAAGPKLLQQRVSAPSPSEVTLHPRHTAWMPLSTL
mmetsp:Transcript_68241/g.120732  ORF Transcript_68241/g.120732 Transcript_68241/m.120732 type:complete len:98 (+) Transcript_68241:409-702(+)